MGARRGRRLGLGFRGGCLGSHCDTAGRAALALGFPVCDPGFGVLHVVVCWIGGSSRRGGSCCDRRLLLPFLLLPVIDPRLGLLHVFAWIRGSARPGGVSSDRSLLSSLL